LPAITAYQPPNLSQTYSTLVGAGLPAMAACQPTNPSQIHATQTVGAGSLAKTACQPPNLSQTYSTPVGTGLPAMAVCQVQQGWLGWCHRRQAELLRGGVYNLTIRPAGRPPRFRFCGARPLERPRGGSAQWATRHGCRVSRPGPWMADGGGPTEQDRSEGMPSLGEAPNERGKSPLVTLGLFQSDPP
jgi:hypothetical protein